MEKLKKILERKIMLKGLVDRLEVVIDTLIWIMSGVSIIGLCIIIFEIMFMK